MTLVSPHTLEKDTSALFSKIDGANKVAHNLSRHSQHVWSISFSMLTIPTLIYIHFNHSIHLVFHSFNYLLFIPILSNDLIISSTCGILPVSSFEYIFCCLYVMYKVVSKQIILEDNTIYTKSDGIFVL